MRPHPSCEATTNSGLSDTSECFHIFLAKIVDIARSPWPEPLFLPSFGSLSTGSRLFWGWLLSASGARFRICQGLRRRKKAPLYSEKDPGLSSQDQGRMADATLDLESSCEIHCDHHQWTRDEHLNVFHDRSQHRWTRVQKQIHLNTANSIGR